MNSPAPIQVLLVEDNPGDARLVREALLVSRRATLNLSHVETVREALEFIAAHEVSVVLLDLSLPDGYGLDTFTKVHTAVPDLPILVVTSLDDEEVALRAMREGAQDYLVKGYFDSVSPERAIRYAIERQRIEKENRRLNAELEHRVRERTSELEKLKTHLENILNYSPEPILALSTGGSILTANPAFSQMFGYSQPDLPGLPLTALAVPEFALAIRTTIRSMVTQRSMQQLDVIARRQDGSIFDAHLSLAPTEDQDGAGVVCIVRDVSGLKEVERLKDDFVSNVSHELRTPITSMKLNISLLIEGARSPDVLLPRLERECNRLVNIVENLLALARMEQGNVALKPDICDVNEIVREYAADRQEIATSNDQTLTLEIEDDLPGVVADGGMIGLVISILLTNAVNYTPRGGQITIRTHAGTGIDKGWVTIAVTDNGPGITEDEQEKLFVRFYRGTAARATGRPGTGLGLAIARQIMEQHAGRIEVQSEGIPGKGTAFTVWLPIDTSA